MSYQSILLSLLDEADLAYQDARRKVWDRLAPGDHLDVAVLDPSQRESLRKLEDAESAVATHREFLYVTNGRRQHDTRIP